MGSATGVYHVSKFNSSVRTISSPDITRFSSSSISCTSENDFSGFGTCAQHGNIGSQAVRAEPALLEKRIFFIFPRFFFALNSAIFLSNLQLLLMKFCRNFATHLLKKRTFFISDSFKRQSPENYEIYRYCNRICEKNRKFCRQFRKV